MKYTVERDIKTETDTRAEEEKKKGGRGKVWASSTAFCQKHKPQHPHHVKVSPLGPQ